MESRGLISIWYFIGLLLLVYGVIILVSALLVTPERPPVLAHLRADLWWGVLLTILGAVYTMVFRKK